MRNFFPRVFLAALIVCCTCALNARAQDTNAPAKPKAKSTAKAKPATEKTTTFSGKLAAIDKVMKTITLDDKKKTVIEVTSDTLITKDGKPAILSDGVTGQPVNGTAKKADDGKLSGLLLNFGKKAEAPKKTAKPKKEKESKPAETNAAPVVAPMAPPAAVPPMSVPVLTPPSTNTP